MTIQPFSHWLELAQGLLASSPVSIFTLTLQGGTDPAPAFASKKQAQQQFEREFKAKSYRFTA